MTRILVALGGNAIKKANEKGTTEEQFKNCIVTTKILVKLVKSMNVEDRLIITHGNGPQVGNLMVQQEAGKSLVPPHSYDILGAMTQGQIGYMLQQTLTNSLRNMGINMPVVAVVNQVLVDKNDPEFFGDAASKPVGNFLTEEEAMELKKRHPNYIVKKVKPIGERCWRRTVPSPNPILNVESEAIKKIVDNGIIAIVSGGGGIPIIDNNGYYKGVEAVIDKDLSGEKIGEAINADILLILTDVEKVKLYFATPNEKELDSMTLLEAKKYFKEGHFLPGSMGPKVMACIRFLEWGGKKAIITSLDKAIEALEGRTGTHIC